METKEYNGKTYQQLETYEEAESLLGKKLISGKENCNLKSKMLVTHVKLFENNSVKVNKLQLDYLFRFYTHEDGCPVGKVVEEIKFELPKILAGDWYAIEKCLGLSITETRIRRYIIEQGWTDTKPWDGNRDHFSIVLSNPTQLPDCKDKPEWIVIGEPYYNYCGINIDTWEHAEWLCEQLNKAGIVL